jgi:hypothetical protein
LVNHVRTLLLNQPASAETPLGEYVPPSFRTVVVPLAVQSARNLLFGLRPDAMMLDYRLRQYMAMLHSTELAELVIADDPRITYTPGDRSMTDFDFAPAILPIGHTVPLFLAGDPPTASDGRMTYAWQIKVLIAGYPGPVAAVTRRSPTSGYAEYPISYANNLSNEFPLDGSPLRACFNSAGVVDGIAWNVDCLAPPVRDPGQVAADLGAAGANVLGELFGFTRQEPYLTYNLLWSSKQPLPYRLGAVLLAVAARTDEARKRSS